MQCIRACLQACRRNALSRGFSRRCCPPCQAGKTTFGEPVPPDLSPVATLLLRALRDSNLDKLHGSFSRTQDIFSLAPLRARSRPSQRLQPILFRHGSARLKACPDTKPVKPKRAPKCRNSRDRFQPVLSDKWAGLNASRRLNACPSTPCLFPGNPTTAALPAPERRPFAFLPGASGPLPEACGRWSARDLRLPSASACNRRLPGRHGLR